MKKNKVLVVDDEKNIRITVAQSLEKIDLETNSAVSGEEALKKLKENGYNLILLDLKLPGMDGMEVLRQIRGFNSTTKILIITAYGTIENAVEAMKLGAVDFIQKPFTPDEIRGLVSKALLRKEGFLQKVKFDSEVVMEKIVDRVLEGKSAKDVITRPAKDEKKPTDYESCIQQAKAAVESKNFDLAESWVKRAIFIDTSRAEAFNFLGVLFELKNDKHSAQKYYRAALSLEPSFRPAWNNLDRSTRFSPEGKPTLEVKPEADKKEIRANFSKKSKK